MKHFIIAFLFCITASAQWVNGGVVLVGNSQSGGAISCDVEADSEATLIQAGNANKIVCVTGDITLTTNRTLPSGMILTDGGGSITFGSFTLTGVLTDIQTPYDRDFFIINGSGGFSDASTFNISSGFVNVDAWNIVGDGNIDTGVGTDNKDRIQDALNVASYGGWYAQISTPGVYMVTPTQRTKENQEPTSLHITGDGTTLELGGDVDLAAKTSSGTGESLFEMIRGQRMRLIGAGRVVGNLKHRTTVSYVSENGPNIATIACQNCEVGVSSINSAGSNVRPYADGVGLYFLDQITTDDFTTGFDINASSGAFEAKVGHAYSILWDMGSHSKGYFNLHGGSLSGDMNLDTQQYYVAWYDDTDAFITKTDLVETYQRIRIPTDASKLRLVVLYNGTFDAFGVGEGPGTLAELDFSYGVKITSPLLKRGLYQGISNPEPFTVIDGVTFEEHGRTFSTVGITPGQGGLNRDGLGFTGSPGYAIDIEDGFQALSGIKILNSRFKNNKAGDLIIKGGRKTEIAGNTFQYNDYADFVVVNSLSLGNAEEAIFHDNVVEDRNFRIGRRSLAYGNIFKDCTFDLYDEGVDFHDNYILDLAGIKTSDGSGADYQFPDSTAIVRNNTFVFTKPGAKYGNTEILTDIYNIEWKNNTLTGLRPVEFTGLNLSNWGPEPTLFPKGYIDRMKISNIFMVNKTDGWQILPMDINELESSLSLRYRPGGARDFYLKNSTIYGNINGEFDGFGNSGSGPFKTFTIQNTIIKPPSTDYINTIIYPLTIEAKDINLKFIGGAIDLTDFGDVPQGDDFFNLDLFGTSLFDGVDFKTEYSSANISLSPSTGGDITFKNCTLNGVPLQDGVNITLRAGDVIN